MEFFSRLPGLAASPPAEIKKLRALFDRAIRVADERAAEADGLSCPTLDAHAICAPSLKLLTFQSLFLLYALSALKERHKSFPWPDVIACAVGRLKAHRPPRTVFAQYFEDFAGTFAVDGILPEAVMNLAVSGWYIRYLPLALWSHQGVEEHRLFLDGIDQAITQQLKKMAKSASR